MDIRTWYPEIRTFIDSYSADEVAERLPELMAYNEPIVVTHPRRPPMVLLPASTYDDLIAAMASLNNLIELRRQSVEPLPPMSV